MAINALNSGAKIWLADLEDASTPTWRNVIDSILNLRDGDFGFYDYTGYKVTGNRKFECEMTIREGKIVYDLNGIANPVVQDDGR